MKVAKKTNGRRLVPAFRNWVDDFWGTDKFFDDDFFSSPLRKSWMPAINIKENEIDFDIEVAVPGMKKSDFSIEVQNGLLCISAEREESKEEKETNYTRREFNYNSFERTFTLPENVNPDKINATYKDGVLKVNLKKLKVEKPEVKKIAIS